MSPSSSPPPSLLTPLINSGDCNIMLAAVLSLLLVIFFVLLLHVYSKWFLSQSIRRNTNSQFNHFHNYTNNPSRLRLRPHSNSDFPTKGLDISVISLIPLFTHKSSEYISVLECVVCLSAFEDGELGRKLRNCGHHFHVDCIDMWLYSHTSCPICREPVICELGKLKGGELLETVMEIRDENRDSDNENVTVCDSLPSSSSSMSVKRMVSKNRVVDVKVHSSTDEIELDA